MSCFSTFSVIEISVLWNKDGIQELFYMTAIESGHENSKLEEN